MTNIERRTITNTFEVRNEGDKTTIVGYAAVFNSLSQNLGGFVEQVQPGAFKKTLQEADVRALFNHDPNIVLGRNKAGTLRLSEDAHGLHYEVDLPSTSQARDLGISMDRGDISQSSFGFRVIRDAWGTTDENFPLRTLEEVALYDVSPVTYPAYTAASSALRSLAKQTEIDIEVLVEAANAGELRSYILSTTDSEEDLIVAETAFEVVEARNETPEEASAGAAAQAKTDEPGSEAHLSAEDAKRRLRDAEAGAMPLRYRLSGR